jgi:hypothetical protein
MMVLQVQTEDRGHTKRSHQTAMSRRSHFAWPANMRAPHGSGQHMYRHEEERESVTTWHITGSRCARQSQPANSSVRSTRR